mgnify:CR=1 FL=1
MFSICINYKQTQGEILNWQDKLNKQGYVQLDNFLTDKVANRLLKSLKNNSHSNAWRLLSRPNQSLPMINASFKNSGLFRQAQKLAISGHKRRQFAFSFWRSSNRYIETNKMKPVIEIFKSEILRNVAAVIKDKPSLTDCFAAKLECNQFIDYHTDGPAGEYAFIYQLSKSWQPRYGGQLILYPSKSRFYRKLLVPKFNTLSILKLDHPMPHSVKMLKTPQHKQRYTISGWIK